MFGEDLSESPRLPSPWRDVACEAHWISRRPSFVLANAAADQEAAKKALESLKLESSSARIGLVPEADLQGHIEYKLRLAAPSQERFHKLVSQLKWRLLEGGGEALYELGVLDNGVLVGLPFDELTHSLAVLQDMAAELQCTAEILREIELDGESVVLDTTIETYSSSPANSSPLHSVKQVVVHENDDFSAVASTSPSTSNAHEISVPESLTLKGRPRSWLQSQLDEGSPVPSRSVSSSGKDFRSLPGGKRFCVEVLIRRDALEPDQDVAFLDFEGFSP